MGYDLVRIKNLNGPIAPPLLEHHESKKGLSHELKKVHASDTNDVFYVSYRFDVI